MFRVEGGVHRAGAGVVTAAGDRRGETSWTPVRGYFSLSAELLRPDLIGIDFQKYFWM